MGRLDGKTALVTGGARGQGAAEARLFAAEGAAVVITDVLAEGEQTASEIGATFIRHDVTSEDEWARVIEQTLERHGGLDVLVNNAGIFRPMPLLGGTVDDFREVIEVNQVGVFLGMRAAAPAMIDGGGGSIVNISSIAGLRGSPGSIGYTTSKWAVRGLSRSAAQQLAPHGVRVNSIHPGLIETAMLHQLPAVDAGGLDQLVERVPLARLGTPEDIAKLALFLASDESDYCTGAEFVIDGGMMS